MTFDEFFQSDELKELRDVVDGHITLTHKGLLDSVLQNNAPYAESYAYYSLFCMALNLKLYEFFKENEVKIALTVKGVRYPLERVFLHSEKFSVIGLDFKLPTKSYNILYINEILYNHFVKDYANSALEDCPISIDIAPSPNGVDTAFEVTIRDFTPQLIIKKLEEFMNKMW